MKTYKFNINGKDYEVVVKNNAGSSVDVSVNGKDYSVKIEGGATSVQPVSAAPTVAPVAQTAVPTPASPAPAPAAPAASGQGKDIVSPLPGVVISVDVKEGSSVKRGQKVAVIEAMKMENEIQADCDGVVTAVHVAKGDSVLEDAKIVTIG